MTGGTEQQGAVFLAERLVLLIYRNGVRSLVLIGEIYLVAYSVAFFVLRKDLRHGILEELGMLRGDGDGKVAGAVRIAHVFLRLHKVLRNGRTDLRGIPVELEDALGLGAVGKAGLLEQSLEGLLTIFGAVLRLSEEFRAIEGEVLDAGRQLCAGGIGRKVFPCLKFGETAEHVLEHAGSRT